MAKSQSLEKPPFSSWVKKNSSFLAHVIESENKCVAPEKKTKIRIFKPYSNRDVWKKCQSGFYLLFSGMYCHRQKKTSPPPCDHLDIGALRLPTLAQNQRGD